MEQDVIQWAQAVAAGDRRALARALTLVESTTDRDRDRATSLLSALVARGGRTLRLGVSGAPGVGKSSFIEAFGLHLTGLGLKVAVLAVDPSSRRTGGSVLGDKTRMERLVRAPGAYVRPSPSGGMLGGTAPRTRAAVAVCEAAGFDLILVETVGVGQSEVQVAGMVDILILLVGPGGGDEVQGVKRGIVELADLVLVTKADGALAAQAAATEADYAGALHLLAPRPQDPPGRARVARLSALTGAGIAEAWDRIAALADWRRGTGHLAAARQEQLRAAFHEELQAEVARHLGRLRLGALEAEVMAGLPPAEAARRALAALFGETP